MFRVIKASDAQKHFDYTTSIQEYQRDPGAVPEADMH